MCELGQQLYTQMKWFNEKELKLFSTDLGVIIREPLNEKIGYLVSSPISNKQIYIKNNRYCISSTPHKRDKKPYFELSFYSEAYTKKITLELRTKKAHLLYKCSDKEKILKNLHACFELIEKEYTEHLKSEFKNIKEKLIASSQTKSKEEE